ncbi:unnamed protein product [Rotaria sordida]|uniref:Uncharacterized protein n=1 Tax=Rotaria sordida TaxID=392033 RepID=A0A814P211_9BILA|nr:unnamed protein product [Rotaria sordida]CAF1106939.1 unnamed protein product [Rotaria sordida]CAF1163159.1 unnamed protein product [Rotaria sordida]CAF1209804.1 unnamed protein product [Rotaria sordida]CAF3582353.1 unnamed protein product [Rotaria sordida]
MQPADYRLVRSHIEAGIMMAIKRHVFPKTLDDYFSYWLYGQRKSTEQIPVNLSRSIPCLVCSNNNANCEDFSLLTVDMNSFLQCLPLLNTEELSILYSLLDGDQKVYQHAIRQQYQDYKQQLIEILKRKRNERYYLV